MSNRSFFPRALRISAAWLLEQLLPSTCLTCDSLVTQPGHLCAACFGRTVFITDPFCQRCAVPFVSGDEGGAEMICWTCRDHPPAWDQARAALRYDDQSKRLILPLKHADRIEIAVLLAGQMARAGAALLARATLIAPVPLHRRRLFTRRYNQAALLAMRLSALSGLPCVPDALRRLRATPSLDGRRAAERRAALEGAFAVSPARAAQIAGQCVVLIDDVLTSGATAGECARVLRAAGAIGVDVLVAARVPDPRR